MVAATPPVSSSEAIRTARLDFVFRGHPLTLAASLMLASIGLAALWELMDHTRLCLWYATFVAITVSRYALYLRYERARAVAGEALDVNLWSRRVFLGALCAGTAWGSASLLVPPDLTVQLFLSFVLAGNSAGAVTTLSADRRTAIAFVSTSLAPLAVLLLLQGSSASIAIGVMVCIFLVVITHSIHRFHRQILDMVSTRVEVEMQRALQQAQQEVEALNRRLRVATRAAKVGVFEHDLVTGRLDWSEQNCALFGLDPAVPVTVEQWHARIHPTDLARVQAAFSGVSGPDEFEIEYRICCTNGAERDFRAPCSIERDAQGRPLKLIGMNWDITELRRVDRMKSEFVSIVSHELRTPLTSIRGALGLVGSGAAGLITDKVRDLTLLAGRNAERLCILIDDILDIEKMESGRMRFEVLRQPLFPLLEQALAANTQYAAKHGVELKLRSPNLGIYASTDANRFLQVMANLLSNAAKFSPHGSSVEVTLTEADGVARISVRDYGKGIAEDFRTKIFGKFSQGDAADNRTRGGSGLGLAISKTIVELMGGTIGFTSHEIGTTFFFDLPVCHPEESGCFARVAVNLPVELA